MAGIYIHIPFCKQACHYCDFHFSTNRELMDKMTDSICKELELRKNYFGEKKTIQTIYFGGGTPSLLDIAHLEKILSTISRHFVLDLEETTIETNPDDLTGEKLKELKSHGFDRLSIGVQSFHEEVLKFYNRAHNARESLVSIDLARKTGFEKLSIDLIYGFPFKDHRIWKKDLDKAIQLDPGHISSYCLTVESNTALGRWEKTGKFHAASEDFTATQFELLQDNMELAGYIQYEISNFGKLDCFALHNSNYWRGVPYLGIGPSAHSFDGKSRQHNIANNRRYIQAIERGMGFFETDILEPTEVLNEYILTSLRTIWGMDLQFVQNNFQRDLLKLKSGEVEMLLGNNFLILDGHHLQLSKKGKILADSIAEKLFL